MARSHSIACTTRTRVYRPQNHQAMPQTSHTQIRTCTQVFVPCLAVYRIRKLVFFPKRKTRSLPAKMNPYVHDSVRLSFFHSSAFFRSDFIRFRSQFTYAIEIGFASARILKWPPKLHPFVLCERLFLFVHIYFTLLCSAVTHHFSVPSV